jgi:hypothetical protein
MILAEPVVAELMEAELGLSFIPMDFNAAAEGYLL